MQLPKRGYKNFQFDLLPANLRYLLLFLNHLKTAGQTDILSKLSKLRTGS